MRNVGRSVGPILRSVRNSSDRNRIYQLCGTSATNWGERQEFGSRAAQAVRAFCGPLPLLMWAWDENGRQGRIAGLSLG